MDILVTRNSGSVVNVLYYNNGTSNPFSGVAPTDLGTNLAATGDVDVGDIDGDGDADLVIGHTASADEYHLNLGSRTFSAGIAIPVPLDNETRAIRLGDMDLDGMLDQTDVNAFVAGWLTVVPEDNLVVRWNKGDLDLNGRSDIFDLALFQRALQGTGLVFPRVPEPGSVPARP